MCIYIYIYIDIHIHITLVYIHMSYTICVYIYIYILLDTVYKYIDMYIYIIHRYTTYTYCTLQFILLIYILQSTRVCLQRQISLEINLSADAAEDVFMVMRGVLNAWSNATYSIRLANTTSAWGVLWCVFMVIGDSMGIPLVRDLMEICFS